MFADAADEIIFNGGKVIVFGQGDHDIEDALKRTAARFPGRMAVHVGYDEPTAHLIQAGPMPSCSRRGLSLAGSPSFMRFATAACRSSHARAVYPRRSSTQMMRDVRSGCHGLPVPPG